MYQGNFSSDMTWWQQTFGPSRLVGHTASLMNENKVVFILIDKNTAYKHEMREAVTKYYNDNFSPFACDTFDCAEILSSDDDFSAAVVKSFTDGEEPLLYKGETVVDFAVREGIFSDKILWFKGIESAEILAKAAGFAAQYNKKCKKDNGVVVIETPREFADGGYGNFRKVDTAGIITETDTEVFALNIYRSKNEREGRNVADMLSKYVSVLATCVCGTNAELAERLIISVDLTGDGVTEEIGRTMGGRLDTKELNKRIWEAQLKTFFPLIEERRLFFVSKYESFFRGATAILGLKDKVTGEAITDPYDLETGQLLFCLNIVSSTVTTADFNEIRFLRDVRNNLAHLEILDKAKTERLIAISEE